MKARPHREPWARAFFSLSATEWGRGPGSTAVEIRFSCSESKFANRPLVMIGAGGRWRAARHRAGVTHTYRIGLEPLRQFRQDFFRRHPAGQQVDQPILDGMQTHRSIDLRGLLTARSALSQLRLRR